MELSGKLCKQLSEVTSKENWTTFLKNWELTDPAKQLSRADFLV